MIVRVAFFTSTRGEISSLSPIIHQMYKTRGLKPLLFVGGTHLKKNYGYTVREIKKEKLKISSYFNYSIKGNSQSQLSNSLAKAHEKISKIFKRFKFDCVFIIGDRFEKLAEVNNSIVFNKPIIHYSGGEETAGVIDDQVRHMITKSAHLHFVQCDKYKKNILRMGEESHRVFNVGNPLLENIKKIKFNNKENLFKKYKIDSKKPLSIFTYHPVTLKTNLSSIKQIQNIFETLKRFNIQFLITSPGHDHGRDVLLGYIQKRVENNKNFFYVKSLGFKNLLNFYKYADFVMGNSSSGIYQAPFFKIPTINIGERQTGRYFHKSIINCGYKSKEIYKAVKKAQNPNFLKSLKKMKFMFGSGNTAKKIIQIIRKTKIDKKLIWKKLAKR
jgi:UDP-hydrolysing UDP-N-acetyl-D-glucosamine 2-epimerase